MKVVYVQVGKWPAMERWSRKYLRKAFKHKPVIVGEYPMAFQNYLTYMDASSDEMPLVLFDKHFADKAPELAQDYEVSSCSCVLDDTSYDVPLK